MAKHELTNESKKVLLLSGSQNNQPISTILLLVQEEWKNIISIAKMYNILPLVFEKASENEDL